ncbi:ribosomal lysine N-methyltransferase 5 [Chaetomidium leptoderma]|uniref:Ribosomal lysine N-methyltransferase 5 n=1 Tax=Chaetomidium leptoderma TaxID=669021 RepID=A0AAN6VUL9_9PEZI|nr:ribosomal lysine N-methyltransferase 5 [Chaetomidium leptoderma]
MKLDGLLRALGAPVLDAEEETFELFSQDLPSQNLGFIDSRASTLELTVAGRDLTIHQSPGILSSNRAGGTTGAVVWKITPPFAEWLASPSNPLFTHGVLSPSSVVVELGCGISGIVALLLAPRIARYVLTDQPYVAKLVEQNLAENNNNSYQQSTTSSSAKASARGNKSPRATPTSTPRAGRSALFRPPVAARNVSRDGNATAGRKKTTHFTPLDWETDEVTPSLTGVREAPSFDVVVACDCIYNEALVEPFVTTCVDLCRLRGRAAAAEAEAEQALLLPCVCVVAQQLRDPLVFEAWATRFATSFHTWRVPDEWLVPGLRSNSGFVVHVGVLKGDITLEAV